MTTLLLLLAGFVFALTMVGVALPELTQLEQIALGLALVTAARLVARAPDSP